MCVDSCIHETFVILRIDAAESPLNNENLLRYHSNLSRRDEATFIKLIFEINRPNSCVTYLHYHSVKD